MKNFITLPDGIEIPASDVLKIDVKSNKQPFKKPGDPNEYWAVCLITTKLGRRPVSCLNRDDAIALMNKLTRELSEIRDRQQSPAVRRTA